MSQTRDGRCDTHTRAIMVGSRGGAGESTANSSSGRRILRARRNRYVQYVMLLRFSVPGT